MKKFLSLLLATVMILTAFVLLTSCNDSEVPEVQDGVKVDTVAGKTGKQAYDDGVQVVEKMEKFDITISAIYTSTYNGENMSSTEVKTVYKSNGSSYYYDETSFDLGADNTKSNETINRYWYVNNELYSILGTFKEKNTITAEQFQSTYMVGKEGLIFSVDDSSFENVKFLKINDQYILNVNITPENYYAYTGVEITGNAECKMVFDKDANMKSFCIVAGYNRGDGIVLYIDREITFHSIGTDVVISLPENLSDFRVAPEMNEIDMSSIASNVTLVETTEKTDLVKMTTNYGDIIIRLYPEVAPITVENFKNLVAEKFYDGLTFHRVVKDQMVQCGDPKGDSTGGSGKDIVGEFDYNGFTNNLMHKRGVVSMARSQLYDSASSQFFIVHTDNLYWDGQYATFGYVVRGMDVVDTLNALDTDENDKPLTEAKIISVRFVKAQ